MLTFYDAKPIHSLTRSVLLLVLFSALLPFATAQTIEQRYKELPNFHQVDEQLYRGAQPTPGGIRRLAKLGINTIVNLRADDERSSAERDNARAAGLRYFQVPFSRLGAPTDEQIERVLSLIGDEANGKVFVHCQRGADRTGTVIAVYRISHDGWTSEQAKEEANKRGMKFWQRGMKNYIRDYYRTDKQNKAARESRACPKLKNRFICKIVIQGFMPSARTIGFIKHECAGCFDFSSGV